MMQWQRLLSARRLGHDTAEPVTPARSPFQKDWDRIVFCSAFRRLQDKTQVHSMPASDYVRTARAKGLSERAVLFTHVLRNALLPILTGSVAALPLLFMGSLIAESFFGIPGLGSYTLDALGAQDFSVVRAMVFLGSSLYIVGLIMADISYTLADPRVRFE